MTSPPEPSLERAIATLRAASEYAQARDLALESVQDIGASGRAGTEEHARALFELGCLHDDLADYESALAALGDAAEMAEGLARGRGLAAVALARMAGIFGSLTRVDEADRAMSRALTMAKLGLQSGDPGWAEVLAEAAMLEIDEGDLEEAERRVGEALEAADRVPAGSERDRVASTDSPRGSCAGHWRYRSARPAPGASRSSMP
jgi:tetratricopeptide (TPR) repeat protein